jgi:hypothetical protein
MAKDKDDGKKVFKFVQKDSPPEEDRGATPNELLQLAKDNYDDLIIVGWGGESFKISWTDGFTPEEVYVQLELAKARIMDKLYQF